MKSVRSTPAVLFLVFNRPDTAARVFEKIREAQPKQLFVAADGPRADRDGEEELCAQTRKIIADIDWDCDLKTLYRNRNLGCREAVSSAITWFFKHVEEGIILEDDCLPEATFFPFCAELLERYRHDERVMSISGDSYGSIELYSSNSYSFTKYTLFWGWATWRRAWKLYDPDLTYLEKYFESGWFDSFFGSEEVANYWRKELYKALDGNLDTWGYRWLYSVFNQGASSIMAATNLISNIGCDSRASHTKSSAWDIAERPTNPMQFPLKHPFSPAPNPLLNEALESERYKISIQPRYLSKFFSRFDHHVDEAIWRYQLAKDKLRRSLKK